MRDTRRRIEVFLGVDGEIQESGQKKCDEGNGDHRHDGRPFDGKTPNVHVRENSAEREDERSGDIPKKRNDPVVDVGMEEREEKTDPKQEQDEVRDKVDNGERSLCVTFHGIRGRILP
jgi:hypothetical protein